MSNQLPETFVKRWLRELDDAWTASRKRPLQVILLVLALVIWLGWNAWSNHSEAQKLQHEVAQKKLDIAVLETQLAPFRTVALQQFPGKKAGEALSELAVSLQRLQEQFENSLKVIHSFSITVGYEIEGDWKKGYEPGAQPLFTLSGSSGSAGSTRLLLRDGRELQLNFNSADGDSVRKIEGNRFYCENCYTVPAGAQIYSVLKDDIAAVSNLQFYIWGVSRDCVTDPTIRVTGVKVTLFVNGVLHSACNVGQGILSIDTEKQKKNADGFPETLGASWTGHAALLPPVKDAKSTEQSRVHSP